MAQRGYIQKWKPPPTIDDYMWEVQQSIWWNHRERAIHQLMWLMEIHLGDHDGKEAALSKI